MKTERVKILVLLLGIVFVLAMIPIAQIIINVYGSWQGVPPSLTNDQFYYMARLKQISNGYLFVGNPYILEYKNSLAPAFFVADWLAAIPLLLGLSLNATAALNMVFWPMILIILLYFIFEQLGLKPKESLVASVLTYLQVYWLMVRPVVMQTVFPFFALFILSYILWIKSPLNKKNIIFLTLSCAASLYVYTYLWQIVYITLFLTAIFLIFKRNWKILTALLFSGVISIVLAVPTIIYMIKQINSSFYWESMARIGLVFTRIPTMNFFVYGYWIIIAFVLGILVYSLNFHKEEDSDILTLFFLTGTALLIASGSNIVLGKELETANHIGRFIIFWFSMPLIYFLVCLWRRREGIASLFVIKKMFLCLVVSAAIFVFLQNFYSQLAPFVNDNKARTILVQDYAKPMEWLNKNVPSEQVVWTLNQNIEAYIPILTHNYLLFSGSAVLQLMPSTEIEERYLVSNYFNNLTLQDIERDFGLYAGAGVAIHQYKTHNREVRVCQILHLEKLGYSCGKIETDVFFKGEDYFINLYNKYINEIKPNIKEYLKKYEVSYILLNKKIDQLELPLTSLPDLNRVYQDDRFEIYKITRL